MGGRINKDAVSTPAETLARCIEQSVSAETHDFQWDVFFRLWFRQYGKPCFFLFKRHLGVTNTQYVELFSLLQLYCIDSATGANRSQLLFHRTDDMKATVVDTVNTILEAPASERGKQLRTFCERYANMFQSTLAVDMFYCSCAAFLPPGLDLDLRRICFDAGYIHSVGYSVFVRNIKKARHKDFDSGLRSYLDLHPNQLPIPFVVYAHEDFSGYDRDAREQINRGIEHTKLFLEKMSMGAYRLAQIVQEMKEKYAGRLEIPEPGPYDEVHKFDKDTTLWLISDRSLNRASLATPGNDRYYICYEQIAKNDAPLFLFDENKPGWKSHTTLPHSLTAALINMTRPHPPLASICDPFSGTGTTWLETKRIVPRVNVRCSDRSPITPLLVRDNLEFFLMSVQELAELERRFVAIAEEARNDRRGSDEAAMQRFFDFATDASELAGTGPYVVARGLLDELRTDQPYEDQEFSFSVDFVRRLEALAPITRFVFYIVLRAELRYQGGFKRKSVTFDKAFATSVEELVTQIRIFARLKQAVGDAKKNPAEDFLTFRGSYSTGIYPAFLEGRGDALLQAWSEEIHVRDARDLAPNSLDVILCDPPYGFNTTEDQAGLANLYSDFLDSAIVALRDRGHLIICLPAESFTGRDLPYCTRSNLVINHVLTKAEALGKRIYLPAQSLPSLVFRPPYYWESERALRRVILHFRIATPREHGETHRRLSAGTGLKKKTRREYVRNKKN